MGLEKFRKSEAVTFEVEGAEFVVDLPTRWNKQYTRAWQSFLQDKASVSDDGSVSLKGKISPAELSDVQERAFADICIISGPLTSDQLVEEYPALLSALFDASAKLASEVEAEAEALTKKLSPTLNGASSGKGSTSSMKSSKEQVASLKVM